MTITTNQKPPIWKRIATAIGIKVIAPKGPRG
jgi:hypothetical protein